MAPAEEVERPTEPILEGEVEGGPGIDAQIPGDDSGLESSTGRVDSAGLSQTGAHGMIGSDASTAPPEGVTPVEDQPARPRSTDDQE